MEVLVHIVKALALSQRSLVVRSRVKFLVAALCKVNELNSAEIMRGGIFACCLPARNPTANRLKIYTQRCARFWCFVYLFVSFVRAKRHSLGGGRKAINKLAADAVRFDYMQI